MVAGLFVYISQHNVVNVFYLEERAKFPYQTLSHCTMV